MGASLYFLFSRDVFEAGYLSLAEDGVWVMSIPAYLMNGCDPQDIVEYLVLRRAKLIGKPVKFTYKSEIHVTETFTGEASVPDNPRERRSEEMH